MTLSRRQFIVAGLAAGVVGGTGALIATGVPQPAFVWRGAALGGEARVSLYGTDKETAHIALDAVAREIDRLEDIFSLHRASSEISRLNRDGLIVTPSNDLIEVLRSALAWRSRTNGAFDPTVQPLWQAASEGRAPSREILALAGTSVDIRPERIVLQPGASLTLNGIAQGHIADRVTQILIGHGFTDVVIDAGELRLPGTTRRPVGIPAAKTAVSVAGVAIATSEPKTMVFDAKTFRHHLVDPLTGESPRHWLSLSVFAPTAEMADALSTAFAVLPYEAVADLVATIGDVAIIGSDARDRIRRMGDLRLTGSSQALS
jgi:thiamine biosynthesis lipoprotein